MSEQLSQLRELVHKLTSCPADDSYHQLMNAYVLLRIGHIADQMRKEAMSHVKAVWETAP